MTDQKQKKNMTERVHRFVTNDFTIRATAVNATQVISQMQQIHMSRPIPTVAVGRAMVGALLLASHLKKDQEIGLLFRGTGALGVIYAQAAFDGKVRGYTHHPEFEPKQYETQLRVGPFIGAGELSVVRHQPFQKHPYQGTVTLVSGEIAEDIANYLHQSQQIRSIVSLGVHLDTYGRVMSAGGVIVEVMPGVENSIIDKLEENHKKNHAAVSQLILQGKTPIELVQMYLTGFEFTEIEHDYPIEYHCSCTKEKVMDALSLVGLADLNDMIIKQEGSSVTCQMCGRTHELSTTDVEEVRNRLVKSTMH